MPTDAPSSPWLPAGTLTIRPWPDPVVDEVGFDPRSPYTERYWLGILGPSATWLVRNLADELERQPAGFDLDLAHTARALGLGAGSSRRGPFMRSVRRICQFGAAQQVGIDTIRVRRKLPPLTRIQLARLPDALRAEHPSWVTRPPATSARAVEQMRRRSRRLALSLLELGDGVEEAERQLLRWKVAPVVAREATAWALARHRAAAEAAGLAYGDDTDARAPA